MLLIESLLKLLSSFIFINTSLLLPNDCLTASIQYNKDYYSDNELKPTEEIFFSISIVPLATLNTPSVR